MEGSRPALSVIIPTYDGYRGGNLPLLLADLRRQTLQDFEVIAVKGVRPNGRARNVGVSYASGKFLVFIDDDVRLGPSSLLESLLATLQSDPSIGLAGASRKIPEDSNSFQKRQAMEIPRTQTPIFEAVAESDLADHMCLAIPASLYREVGGEHEEILRGTDPDLKKKLRERNLKIVISPRAWAFHPAPATLKQFFLTHFCNGRGTAWVFKKFPSLSLDVSYDMEPPLLGGLQSPPLWQRTIRYACRTLGALLQGKLLLLTAFVAYACGYLAGLLTREPPPSGTKEEVTIFSPCDLPRLEEKAGHPPSSSNGA